jgi:hypothetical protein
MSLDEPSAPVQLAHATVRALRDGSRAALGATVPLAMIALIVARWTVDALGWTTFGRLQPSWVIETRIADHPLAHIAAIPAGVLAVLLLVAGPLAAFGRAALGKRATVWEAIALGFWGSVRVLPLHSILAVAILAPALIFDHLGGQDFGRFLVSVVAAIYSMLLAPYFAVRFFALATVALMVEPHGWRDTLVRAVKLGRGQLALFSFAWLAPIALFVGAILGPADHARALLERAVGGGADKLVTAATIAAAVLAVWLGCAIQAASYAVATGRSARPPRDPGSDAPRRPSTA